MIFLSRLNFDIKVHGRYFSQVFKSAHPEISPGGVQNEKIENSQTLPE